MLKKLFLCIMPLSLTLSGCVSPEEVASANKIITALPTEVEGCTFLGDVDTAGSANIENARFFLKRDVALKGGTHLVEMHAYPVRMIGRMLGVALYGRAYKCPVGKGPIVTNDEALLKRDFPLVDPIDDDDPFAFW